MNMAPTRTLFLTFDVEDFVNDRSIKALHRILEILNKNELQALFFITGHMAEKLVGHEEILDLLHDHQIGYHSSSHSVRPTILEYTDVEDYAEGRLESIRRETSHINPLTGSIEGRGGIHSLRELFPDQKIKAFRAPDYGWSPPHLQALTDLGVNFDFSTRLFPEPASFRGINFYPYPIYHYWNRMGVYRALLMALPRKRTIVLNFHDWYFVNVDAWNRGYTNGNPEELTMTRARSLRKMRKMFSTFESFIRNVKALNRTNLITVTPEFKGLADHAPIDRDRVMKQFDQMAEWCKRYYHYEPRNLRKHFEKFFFEN
jgi:hypothetical protein